MSSSITTAFVVLAISSSVSAFSSQTYSKPNLSSTQLYYRSLYHGPDIEPLTDTEKLGSDYTKMAKDKIHHYGPGDFTGYVDSPDLFDGGDSEMGLTGDGNSGLQKFGQDVSPHMTRTLYSKSNEGILASAGSYTDELLQTNSGMDAVRAQQLGNWANQQEISMTNRHMDEMGRHYQEGQLIQEHGYGEIYEGEASFVHPVQVGDNIEGTIVLRAPINHGVAAEELMLKNPYMGYAKFRAAFVGDDSNEWSVTPNDGFLKQNEETQFIVRYTPQNSGVSRAYFVVETEDLIKTWKVIGSTGEYEF